MAHAIRPATSSNAARLRATTAHDTLDLRSTLTGRWPCLDPGILELEWRLGLEKWPMGKATASRHELEPGALGPPSSWR